MKNPLTGSAILFAEVFQMQPIDIFNVIAGIASIASLILTGIIVYKINQFKNSKKFLAELKQANTVDHLYRKSGLAMQVNVDASIEENLTKIADYVEHIHKTTAGMNKFIKEHDNQYMWESREIGLSNCFKIINLLMAHVEVQCLELKYLTAVVPDPTILDRLNEKRNHFIKLAQTTIHTD